ncbi:MAG: hypothetical protein QOI74_2401 [Micromonosporaceae bacterium]|nr:hypothetical protein [Micromonosporaceae bacterium]
MRMPVIVGCTAMAAGLLFLGLVVPQYRPIAIAAPQASTEAKPVARPLLQARPVAFTTPQAAGGFQAWALLDTRTSVISGSDDMSATSDTVSMVKAWLAADYLRIAAQRRQRPTAARLTELSIMIRDSDNDAAQDIYQLNGSTESIQRLIQLCGLTDSAAVPDLWSDTRMSPRDAVRMGACVADGRAAGPQWTTWLVNEMRHVRGDGRFGVVNALPAAAAAKTAIKNGWLLRDTDGLWHVNCLAAGDGWVLAVMMRYAAALGFEHGGEVCESVTTQLMDPVVTAGQAATTSPRPVTSY